MESPLPKNTTIQLTQGPEGAISGEVTFHGGQKLSLWPGALHEVTAQIHCALRLSSSDLQTRKRGLSFKDMGHALLLQAASLDKPRYLIDEILKESNVGYALNWRLGFFAVDKLTVEERITTAAISFNQQMISGIRWFLDNGYALWILDVRKALSIMNAKPYLKLIEEVISRLLLHGVDVTKGNAPQKWHSLPENREQALRAAFDTIDRQWWDLWKNPSTEFDTYLRRYITSKIDVFRTRATGRKKKT
jgi:hypothetical protein